MTKPRKTKLEKETGERGRKTSPRHEANVAGGTAPGALVNRRAADRLRGGHVWVYSSDVESVTLPEKGSANPPALLSVADSRGILLGTALYSPTSQIALRMVSTEAIGEADWMELLEARLRRAIKLRKPMLDNAGYVNLADFA